jgi:ABC-type multidrug transport system fused ATPase/permease subunit
LTVAVNVISNTPAPFSGFVVFAAYSIQAKIKHTPPLSTAQAFTSFAIIELLSTPAIGLLHSIPIIMSATHLVRRIEDYLSAESFDHGRETPDMEDSDENGTTRAETRLKDQKTDSEEFSKVILSVSNLVLRPSGSGSESEKSQDCVISFECRRGSLTTVIGPVGCGKSTLLKAVLREVKPASGTIKVSTPVIGYCSQTPWLPNSKIRNAIIGPAAFEQDWYRSIVHVCALEVDFDRMPQNDLTLMGSRGVVLSGGQKHRIVSILHLPDIECLAHTLFTGSGSCVIFSLLHLSSR